MKNEVIVVDNLSKKFCRNLKRSFLYGAKDIAADFLNRPNTVLRPSEFWALKNVSFTLKRGESIGIVGSNGSGKTTLLKVISGIIKPTSGRVSTTGQIAPLLALGAGFKPVLSGRENIFLNLSVLGVPRHEIPKLVPEVIEFAEIEDSIDAPLSTYSSGMVSRLGFACAIQTKPEVLIVDEVLSVGDARFRTKCRNKIAEMKKSGVSLLIVSHSPVSISALSDNCLWLEKGEPMAFGPSDDILRKYASGDSASGASSSSSEFKNSKSPVRISQISVSGPDGSDGLTCAQPGKIRVTVEADEEREDCSINLVIAALAPARQTILFWLSHKESSFFRIPKGKTVFELDLPVVTFKPGRYSAKVNITSGIPYEILDLVEDFGFSVKPHPIADHCEFHQPRSWQIPEALKTQGPVAGQIEMEDIESDY